MTTKYYLLVHDEKKGPFLRDELIDAGMQRDTLVWFKGCADWTPAGDLAPFEDLLAELPPPRHRRRDVDTLVDFRPRCQEAHLRRPYSFSQTMFFVTIGFLVLGIALSLLAFWLDYQVARDRSLQWMETTSILAAIACGALALISLIAAGIAFLVVLYRAWAIVQDGHVTTTPGAAVGFLFIPLFQLYWIFVATLGLAKELNHFADRHRLAAPRASVLLGATLAVYYVVAAIPFLGTGATVLNLLIAPLFLRSIYRTARCFCTENVRPVEYAERDPRPHATGVALFTGITAMLLGLAGFTCLVTGGFLTCVKWTDYQEHQRMLAHHQRRLEVLEAIPERDRGDNVRRDINMVRNFADMEQRLWVPRAWTQLVIGAVVLGSGVIFSTIAVVAAFGARASNSRLNSSLAAG